MRFNLKKKSLEVIQIAFINSQRGLDVLYCSEHNLFMVPNANYLEIWNWRLTHKIFTLQMKNKIRCIKFIPKNCTVIIYDDKR